MLQGWIFGLEIKLLFGMPLCCVKVLLCSGFWLPRNVLPRAGNGSNAWGPGPGSNLAQPGCCRHLSESAYEKSFSL